MTSKRIKVLLYYLTGNNSVEFKNIIRYFFDRSNSYKVNRVIKSVTSDGNNRKIVFNNYENSPLYFPKEFDFKTLEQVVGECFYKDNWHYYEIEQTRVIEDDIVVDCGAGEGLFSLLIANRCNCVYAIEPLKGFIDCMKITFQGMKNVHIINKAISNKERMAYISGKGINSKIIDSHKGEQISVTTLDKLFYEKNIHVTFIKLDLEGDDYLALQRACNLIRENNPKIAVTTYHNMDHAYQIRELLLKINPKYKIITKGIYHGTGCPLMLHAWV